jgi:hypothetical protein
MAGASLLARLDDVAILGKPGTKRVAGLLGGAH